MNYFINFAEPKLGTYIVDDICLMVHKARMNDVNKQFLNVISNSTKPLFQKAGIMNIYDTYIDIINSFALKHDFVSWFKYARNNDYWWDYMICMLAAHHGSINCLKYAHENGCPWNETTCANAALYGNFECLKYAIENGCPFRSRYTLESALMHDNLKCVECLHQHGYNITHYDVHMANTFNSHKCLNYFKTLNLN